MLRIFLAFFLSLISCLAVCQCCSGGVPIAGNLSLPGSQAQEVQLQLTYDYNRLRDLFNEGFNLRDKTRQRSTHSVLIEASYGFSKDWSLATLFSYVIQERIIETIPGQRQFTQTEGLGDVVLLLRKSLVNNNLWGLSVGIGPKIPVGRNDVRDENDLWLSADLQPGSGAWDGMLWLSGSKYRLIKDRLAFSLTATGRITRTARRLDDTQDYKFGNEFQAYFGLSDRWGFSKFSIDPLGMFRFRHVTDDIVNGLPLPNTGGTFLHAVPGLIVVPSPQISFRLSAEIPLYRFVKGTQLATSQKFTAALFFRFATKKRELFPDINP